MLRNILVILFLTLCNLISTDSIIAGNFDNDNAYEEITSSTNALNIINSEFIDEIDNDDINKHIPCFSIYCSNQNVTKKSICITKSEYFEDQHLLIIFTIDLPPPAIS